ncbi:hypothetical protein BJ684DRAFT_19707 [Piptocephalis cylindrospora]|uniref:GATA-type domain-containing protein n=1 Tax=Piptocephalis cylindrospora TaxID=1907219 RepID=A0A4P9Y4J4_9FUNG|nr:hypothetical protein BJ684DRAFT_19707 [Piptocephalis cylindrospora]|eukprot:RKP13835.1 hypothetical protein BJ684DRAFT_19707 [Piptocephalis cylindrospora]
MSAPGTHPGQSTQHPRSTTSTYASRLREGHTSLFIPIPSASSMGGGSGLGARRSARAARAAIAGNIRDVDEDDEGNDTAEDRNPTLVATSSESGEPILITKPLIRRAMTHTDHIYPTEDALRENADRGEYLVPIHIEVETEQFHVRDSFMWNLHEELFTPEDFARIFCVDVDLPVNAHGQAIAESIRTQIMEHTELASLSAALIPPKGAVAAVQEEKGSTGEIGGVEKAQTSLELATERNKEDQGTTEEDARPMTSGSTPLQSLPSSKPDVHPGQDTIIVYLDLQVGTFVLRDKFSWDPHSTLAPEAFARQLTADLGLGGEFPPLIAHAIHDRLARWRRDRVYGEAEEDPTRIPGAIGMDASVYRPLHSAIEWGPMLQELSAEELERVQIDRERTLRRQRRETSRWAPPTGRRSGGGLSLATAPSPSSSGLMSPSTSGIMSPGPVTRGTSTGGAASTLPGLPMTESRSATFRCVHCGIGGTETPLARRGPDGNMSLCNACGLFWKAHGVLPEHRTNMFNV